ncbi:MAG: DNA polymerase/3'-5' exonuclease PolX [Herpetosiphonaceae bacterium]|nr:DNA polymerase/3'-5' exonuclease PolX [Herpetosiphonaceae bacterium]
MRSNQEVAAVFRNIADAMELLGEDRFKQQAYRRVADAIQALPLSVADYYARGALREIPGVGQAIAAKVQQFIEIGQIDLYERLKAQVPEGVLLVMHVPGVGPKTAMRLYRELGIVDLAGLQTAAATGQISSLKGLGKKLEVAILAGLQERPAEAPRWLLGEMLPLANDLLAAFRAADRTISLGSIAGSLRRAAPVVNDIDLVLCAADPGATLERLLRLPQIATVEERTATSATVTLHTTCGCHILVTTTEQWGAALVMWTGNGAHRTALQRRAQARGMRLEADGVWQGSTRLPTTSEAGVYHLLDLPLIPPELREGWGEIEAAEAGRLPHLVEASDIQADMHMHTAWSDGTGTIAERAETCIARGYHYAVITDHSAYMGMVQGLDAARLRAQRVEIDAVNAELQRRGTDFHLLQGSEVDILPDGSLALPDDVLASLDWVVASLHVSLKQEREVVTARLLQAIYNPHVDCIGHPTGRLLLKRAGADLDMEAVLEAAAETGTVLEIDGAYERLDLDAEVVKRAVDRGIKLAIDSDAHADGDLDGLRYGVLTARRGWASASDIVNSWDWEQVRLIQKA